MSPRGSVEIGIKVTADTAGAEKAMDAFAQVKTQTLEIARANGANEEAVRRLSVAYDQLAATWDTLQDMSARGMITDEEGMAAWAEAEQLVTKEIRELGIESEKTGEKVKKATTSIDWFANANGRSAGTMRVSNERTVLLGQGMAGLVAQYALGANAQSLIMTGMTNIAMMMSTAGPYGMALGFVTQAITVLVQKYFQVEEAANKAAEKEIAAMEARVDAAREAAANEDSYAKALERSVKAIDLKIAALKREREYEEGVKKLAADEEARAAELQKLRDKDAVAAGDMTPEQAAEDDLIRRDKALFDQQAAELAALEQQQTAALEAKAAAEAKYGEHKAAADLANERALAALAAETARKRADEAAKRIVANEAEIEDIQSQRAATASIIGPEYDKVRRNMDAREAALKQQNEAAKAVIPEAMAEEMAARKGLPHLQSSEREKKRAEEAAKALDDAVIPLGTQQAEAEKAAALAEEKKQRIVQEQRDQRETFERNLSPEDKARYAELGGGQTPAEFGDSIAQRQTDAAARAEAKKIREMKEGKGAAERSAKTGADQGLNESLGKLADAAEKGNDGDKQIAARIAEASKALADGATKDELVKVGGALIEAGQLNDAAAKGMLAAAKTALQQAKEALRRVKDLESQVSAL